MNQLLAPAQIHPPQQMAITVPDLYPVPFTSGPTGQHDNPQRHDRQSSNPPSTSWTGDTRHLAQPRQPISPSTQPQTTSPPQNVLFANQPQYSPPGNRDPQGQQRHQPSTSLPVPRNNQYSGSDQMSRPVAIPNASRVAFSSQPVVIPDTSRGGFSPQSLGSPNTSRGGFPSHPQLSPNPSMQGASLSPPQLSPNTSQQGASVYATQFNSQPSSNSQHRRATSSEYDNSRLAVAYQPPPSSHRRDSSVPPTRPGEGERRPDGWGFQPSSAPHVSGASLCVCDLCMLTSAWGRRKPCHRLYDQSPSSQWWSPICTSQREHRRLIPQHLPSRRLSDAQASRPVSSLAAITR